MKIDNSNFITSNRIFIEDFFKAFEATEPLLEWLKFDAFYEEYRFAFVAINNYSFNIEAYFFINKPAYSISLN